MNKTKEFRKECENARTPWSRVAYIYSFLREDLLPEENKSRFTFGRRKSNTQVVIDEIERYMKKYGDFFIFSTLAESPTVESEEKLSKLYNLFIKEIQKINHGKIDRPILKVAKRFVKVLDEDNFLKLYLLHRKTTAESMEKINELYRELSFLDILNNKYSDPIEYDFDEKESEEYIERANKLRQRIQEERRKLGNDLLDPFFELVIELVKHIKNEKEANPDDIAMQEKLDKRLQLLYSYMYDDLAEAYEYVYTFEGPIQIFFDDPKNQKNPKDCIGLYEFLMEINIFSFQNSALDEIPDFKNIVDGIKNSFIPNVSWNLDEYQEFFKHCQTKDIDIPLAFLLIDANKGTNEELDNIFNEFLENNKKEYMVWCLYGDKAYYDYKFQNKQIYTENDIAVYTILVDELINRQSNDVIRLVDIRNGGNGSTSSNTKVGEYIIKCGLGRYEENIPNHRRILQPIIRRRNENAFFEVSDVVDMDVTQEELEQIFYEMLNDGIAWSDAGLGNIGRLKRKNAPRHGISRATQTEAGVEYVNDESESDEIATNIEGKVDGASLDAGECVVIDTDLVYDLSKIDKAKFDSIQYPPYMTTKMIADIRRKYEELHSGTTDVIIDNLSVDENQDIEGR